MPILVLLAQQLVVQGVPCSLSYHLRIICGEWQKERRIKFAHRNENISLLSCGTQGSIPAGTSIYVSLAAGTCTLLYDRYKSVVATV